MLRGEFLRIAAIDFLTFGCGPWDHDFLASHGSELWTMDLTTQPLWNYSVRYVLVLMEVQSRRVVQGAATASPMPDPASVTTALSPKSRRALDIIFPAFANDGISLL